MSQEEMSFLVNDPLIFGEERCYQSIKDCVEYFFKRGRKVMLSIELTNSFDAGDASRVVKRLVELSELVKEITIFPSKGKSEKPTLRQEFALQNALGEHCLAATQETDRQVYAYPNGMTVRFLVGQLPELLLCYED